MGCEGCKGCKGVWLEGLPALQLLAEPPPLRQELLHLNLVNLGQRGRSLGAEGPQPGCRGAAAWVQRGRSLVIYGPQLLNAFSDWLACLCVRGCG